MIYSNGKVKDIKITYIGGGSRAWAWKLMSDLALEESLSGTMTLYDIDHQAASENELFGNKLSQRSEASGKWFYQTAKSLKTALKDADFVVISIQPGTFKEMRSDVHLPEEYGIYQSVGDTVGPGGLLRALRTVPLYREFAENIRDICPDAWVINYTNPMTVCTRTLYEVFPEIKAFGCCHEVFNVQRLLAAMLEERCGISGVKRTEIKTNVLGVNHFTWFDRAYYKNINLFPLFKEFAEDYYESGFQIPGEKSWQEEIGKYAHRVKFDLFLRYGIIGAAGDRHLAEFLPPWYLKDPATVEQWKFNLTTLDWREARCKRLNEQRLRVINGEEEYVIKPSGEDGVRLIKALVGLGEIVANVNMPNHGQMLGIPDGAVVETNAVFDMDSVRPVVAGRLPNAVQTLVLRHIYNQEMTVQAALNNDKELAFKVFLNDPLVTLGMSDARELYERMLKNTKEYLPGWKF